MNEEATVCYKSRGAFRGRGARGVYGSGVLRGGSGIGLIRGLAGRSGRHGFEYGKKGIKKGPPWSAGQGGGAVGCLLGEEDGFANPRLLCGEVNGANFLQGFAGGESQTLKADTAREQTGDGIDLSRGRRESASGPRAGCRYLRRVQIGVTPA